MGSNWKNNSFGSSFGLNKPDEGYVEYMAMELSRLAKEGEEEERKKSELIEKIMEKLTSDKKEKLEYELLAKKGRKLDEGAKKAILKTLEKKTIDQLSSMLKALTNEQQKGIERQDESNQSKGKDEGREPGE